MNLTEFLSLTPLSLHNLLKEAADIRSGKKRKAPKAANADEIPGW